MAEAGRDDLEALLRQQQSLREVIESISSELELRPLLTRIVRHACELLQADNGTIGLVDEWRNIVRTEAAYRMPDDELGAEMGPGVGLAGHVLLTRQPVMVEHYGDIEHPTQLGMLANAVIGMPIFWHEHMIGFFGIGAAPPRRFSEQDLETLMLFARHAAIAITNARLYEAEKRRAARVAIINRISRLISSSLSLDQLLQTAVEAIYEHLNYPNIALLLLDPDDPETLVLRARSGIYRSIVTETQGVGDYRQSIHEGIIGAAARTRHCVLVDDVRSDPRYVPIPVPNQLTSELALPIVFGERLFGVLNIESEQPISQEDADGLEIVADQLSVAMDNARLFTGIQQALEETQLLYQTSQRISVAITVDAVVEAYLEQVAARSRYACTVVLYDFDEVGERRAVVVHGRWSPEEGMKRGEYRLPYTRDTLDLLLDAGETVVIHNVHQDPRVSPALREIQMRDNRPALAFIPLIVRGQRIGLVVLSYPQVHTWPEADLQPYKASAAQLATAIDSRRQNLLLYQRGQQLAVLEERQRLARELHDSVTQLIFSITLIAQSISPAMRRDPAEGERRVNRLLELSLSALAEMRALLAELRPTEQEPVSLGTESAIPSIMMVRRDGLPSALRRHIAALARDGLQITLDAHAYVRQPLAQEEALYRMAQEALNNVVKHAHARQVTVTLSTSSDETRLIVEDDGVGFAPELAEVGNGMRHSSQGGIGLSTLRERAEALGGVTSIHPRPGGGTTVETRLPRKDEQTG